jgi:pyruvate carboxylase subunit B
MLSNLIFQLEEQGARDKYRQILDETARVREELGYPPLVTPTSQVVGVQAVMNVLHGRYKVVPKETKDYCRGMYGKPPAEIHPDIMKKVLGPKWKEEVIDCRPSDLLAPLWDTKKKELMEIDGGSLIKKEEDVMTYILYPQVGLKFLRGQAVAEFTSDALPLPIDHALTRAMVKQSFPEVKQLWLETQPPEKRGGPVQIPTEFQVEVDGEPFEVKVIPQGGFLVAGAGGTAPEKPKDVEGGIKSSMQGTILKVKVKKGDKVKIGDVIATIEAMKMEQEIKCEKEGEVKEIYCKEGAPVSSGDLLMQIL